MALLQIVLRGLLPQSAQQCDKRALEGTNTLPPLSLIINSPLFSVITNSSKGSGKRVKQTAPQLWVLYQFIHMKEPW